jgi:hypothetical protein
MKLTIYLGLWAGLTDIRAHVAVDVHFFSFVQHPGCAFVLPGYIKGCRGRSPVLVFSLGYISPPVTERLGCRMTEAR